MRVLELSITDIDEAVVLHVIPPMPQLTQPEKRLCVVDLLSNQLADDVSCVHINGTDRHDLLTVTFRQFADKMVDEGSQLINLSVEQHYHEHQLFVWKMISLSTLSYFFIWLKTIL